MRRDELDTNLSREAAQSSFAVFADARQLARHPSDLLASPGAIRIYD